MAEVKERPILFSAPMVRGIIAGTKTQTRRVVSPGVLDHIQCLTGSDGGAEPTGLGQGSTPDNRLRIWSEDYPEEGSIAVDCPYGRPGDRLWVRETWAHDAPDLQELRVMVEDAMGSNCGPYYRADGTHEDAGLKWRSPRFMPRWASRLTLEVTGVRVERLQDIREADARAEGVDTRCLAEPDESPECSVSWRNPDGFALDNFRTLWDRINGKRAPWASNPWLWVVSFAVVTNNPLPQGPRP